MIRWWRYYDSGSGGAINVRLERPLVVHETPAGAWLAMVYSPDGEYAMEMWAKHPRDPGYFKWCGKYNAKSWAHDTREKAWNSFRIRKRRQKLHVENQLHRVETVTKWLDDNSDAPDGDVEIWKEKGRGFSWFEHEGYL